MIDPSIADALIIALAGLLAGVLNAIATGGTLITYPALLLVGSAALEANATSAVGLLVGYISGAIAYRDELSKSDGVQPVRLVVLAAVGAVAGTTILLLTDEEVFRRVAPILVLFAVALLAAQPRIARTVHTRSASAAPGPRGRWGDLAVIGCGMYGAYFGAGMGVLIMGVLAILLPLAIQAVNAWKSLLSFVIGSIAALILSFSGLVHWDAAALIAVASAVGALVGVWIARRLSTSAIRWGTAVLGLVSAITLIVAG